MNKEKFYRFIKKAVNSTTVKVSLLFIPVAILLVYRAVEGTLSFESVFDISTFVSIITAFVCQAIALAIINFVGKFCEDATKLTVDYAALVKKYSREKLITYEKEKFPVEYLCLRYVDEKPFTITFNHSHAENKYQLPTQVANKSDDLMTAHKHSVVYNKMNVRLDDIFYDDGKVELLYSKTYYFDSLITNRAMDYKLNNDKTVREIYEPGPFLNLLKDSKLSNHIGFNGFIETADGKLIFVERDGDLSIGKKTLGCSIGASLKTEYAFNEERKLDLKRLNQAIIREINDELFIKLKDDELLTDGIFAFYRDLVEGGKPQFLFYYRLKNLTSEKFLSNFNEKIDTIKKEKNLKRIDGRKFKFISVDELSQYKILPGALIAPNKKELVMMPSASASVVMLLWHLRKKTEEAE